MTQFAQCLCFDLTDTFTGNVEFLTYFLQSTGPSVIQTETESQYFLFSLCQSTQHFHQLFLQQGKCCSIGRNRYIIILNEVA